MDQQENKAPFPTPQQGYVGLFGFEFVVLRVAEDCTFCTLSHNLCSVRVPCMELILTTYYNRGEKGSTSISSTCTVTHMNLLYMVIIRRKIGTLPAEKK